MRQTSPRQMPTWYFMASGRAYRYYTLLKGDLEVVAAKGNLIIPRRNSATGCSFVIPRTIIIIIIVILCLSVFVLFFAGPRPNHGPKALSPVLSQVIDRALLRMCDVPSKTIFWISSMQILPGIFDT